MLARQQIWTTAQRCWLATAATTVDELEASSRLVVYRDLDLLTLNGRRPGDTTSVTEKDVHGESQAYWITAERWRRLRGEAGATEAEQLLVHLGDDRYALGLSPRMTSKDAGLPQHLHAQQQQQQPASSSLAERVLAAVQAGEGDGRLSYEPAVKTLFNPSLTADEVRYLAKARSMIFFHQTHRYCGACGSPTALASAGHSRTCTCSSCAKSWFPRVEPACIMLVANADDSACIVGRQASWPKNRYSVLAGFVDAGETLEQSVAREVLEEVGVHVDPASCRYVASQAFPFPHSLMLACKATAATHDIRVDPSEIEHAFWMPRSQLVEVLATNDERMRTSQLHLPARRAIAHQLLTRFANQTL